jgi:hypothetical protein
MHRSFILLSAAAGLAACGQATDNASTAAKANANSTTEKPKPAYCFFKDSATKGWKASVDATGNVVVTGKAYDEDRRYKALLGPATVSGSSAQVAPTIAPNDTGFGAPGDWWDVKQTIPGSQGVSSITVTCGEKTLATLEVPRKD